MSMFRRGFTLIELVVVITIIGMLATAVTLRLQGVGAKGRENKRKADLLSIQSALELYYANNRSYPSTVGDFGCSYFNPQLFWCGETINYGSKCYEDGCSPGPYIPGLAPLYISKLPTDPIKGKPAAASVAATTFCGSSGEGAGFLYASNGTDYKVLSHCSAEQTISSTDPLADPRRPNHSFAVYSAGGRNF